MFLCVWIHKNKYEMPPVWSSTRSDPEDLVLKKGEKKKIRPILMLMDPNGRAGIREIKPANIS